MADVDDDNDYRHYRSNKDTKPGDFVVAVPGKQFSGGGTSLWRSASGDGIVGKLRDGQVGFVLARFIDAETDMAKSVGDQVLVLAGDQLGWNSTTAFDVWGRETP